ncbi:hypothetical protein [Bradyrhizobium sp. SZCCHNS3014]|nr:hypothetical protein [Bradyrhizobium sp. SZCCHNS3014]
MIFSENRFPLFRITLEGRDRYVKEVPPIVFGTSLCESVLPQRMEKLERLGPCRVLAWSSRPGYDERQRHHWAGFVPLTANLPVVIRRRCRVHDRILDRRVRERDARSRPSPATASPPCSPHGGGGLDHDLPQKRLDRQVGPSDVEPAVASG